MLDIYMLCVIAGAIFLALFLLIRFVRSKNKKVPTPSIEPTAQPKVAKPVVQTPPVSASVSPSPASTPELKHQEIKPEIKQKAEPKKAQPEVKQKPKLEQKQEEPKPAASTPVIAPTPTPEPSPLPKPTPVVQESAPVAPKPEPEPVAQPPVKIDALLGQEGLVVQTIQLRQPGRVKVKGQEWPAIAANAIIIHQGSVVTVLRIDGDKLVVS